MQDAARRLVVLGAGQLGTALRQVTTVDPCWSTWSVRVLDHAALDICHAAAVESLLPALQPTVLINAAAYNHVDEAETQPGLAFAVNASAPAQLARLAARLGARFVQISTDYVFSGAPPAREPAPRPYREDDLPAPLSVYGVSKLAGEHLALAYAPDALVVRTSGVYGPRTAGRGKRSFVEAIVQQASPANRSAEDRPPVLRVVDDQRASPTYALDLARAILDLVRLEATGIVHVTNAGSCSWFEFARAVLDLAALPATLEPITSSMRPAPARRPAYSVLDHARLRALGLIMPPWRDALRRYLQAHAASLPPRAATGGRA